MDGGAWWAVVHGVAKSRIRLHFPFSLSCIGEGNGNPLQCSCLGRSPRDGGTWWAAVYGVTQSWTRLRQLSSSSRENPNFEYLAQNVREVDAENLSSGKKIIGKSVCDLRHRKLPLKYHTQKSLHKK